MTVNFKKKVFVDLDTATQGLREIANERPDHVDPGASEAGGNCSYAQDDKPSCIVGVFLHRLGAPVSALYSLDEAGVTADLLLDAWADGDLVLRGFEFTPEALIYLRWVQSEQDHGRTWGAAVALAEETLALGI